MGILEIVYASVVENDTVDDNHTTGNRTNSKTKNCGDDDCNENNDTSTKLFGMSIPGILELAHHHQFRGFPIKYYHREKH